MGEGKKKWFFITSDYAFGHSLEENATEILKARRQGRGPRARCRWAKPTTRRTSPAPPPPAPMPSASASGGADFINAAKQMGEFGLIRSGIVPAALNCSLTNIHSLGLPIAQGMIFSQPYYWDQTDATRAFAARFAKLHGRPPTAFQASTWGAVTHYLKSVQAAGTDAAPAVMEKMRAIPINDFMTKDGRLRIDGTVLRDGYISCAPRRRRNRTASGTCWRSRRQSRARTPSAR